MAKRGRCTLCGTFGEIEECGWDTQCVGGCPEPVHHRPPRDMVEDAKGLLEMGATMIEAGTVAGLLGKIQELEAETVRLTGVANRLRESQGAWYTWASELSCLPSESLATLPDEGLRRLLADAIYEIVDIARSKEKVQ